MTTLVVVFCLLLVCRGFALTRRAVCHAVLVILQKSDETDILLSLEHQVSFPLASAGIVAEQLIDLVERPVLQLWDEEENPGGSYHTHEAQEDVRAVGCGSNEVWSRDGDAV